MKKLLLSILMIVVLAVALFGGSYVLGRWRSSTLTPQQRWLEDLARLEKVMTEEHGALSHYVEPQRFQQAASDLRRLIETSQLQDLDDARMQVALLELVALVGDPHTEVYNLSKVDGRYPFYVHWFSDGPLLLSGRDDHADVLGLEVVRICDQPIEQVVERLRTVVPHRNQSGYLRSLPFYLRNPVVLHGVGIAPALDRVTMTLVDSVGTETDVEFRAMSQGDFGRITDYRSYRVRQQITVPLYGELPERNYWLRHLPEHGALYVRYRRAVNQKDLPVTRFWETVLASVDSLEPQRLVLDLRGNGGGNNFYHLPLVGGIRARPQLNRRGKLFTVTDGGTFSAAVVCVTDMMQETETLIVGEPCGDAPLLSGDARFYTLPHSRLQVGISTLLWNNTFEDDRRRTIEPDMAIQRASIDYRTGADPILAAIWSTEPDSLAALPRPGGTADPAWRNIAAGDAREAVARIEAAHDAMPQSIAFRRNNLSMEAFRAYHFDRDEEAAFTLLDANRRLNPEDPFVYIRRGQMSWMTGQRLRAIGNYAWILPASIRRYFSMKNMNDHFLPF